VENEDDHLTLLDIHTKEGESQTVEFKEIIPDDLRKLAEDIAMLSSFCLVIDSYSFCPFVLSFLQKHRKMFVRHLTANVEGNISAPSRIIPDYRGGSTSPYFSTSIPFVTSAIGLRTNGEPFIAAYEVSADIVQPKIIKHLENATTTNTSAVR
jgi:hypothetical protein